MQQRTERWFESRRGLLTASRCYAVYAYAYAQTGKKPKSLESLMWELATERLLTRAKVTCETAATQWGIEHESAARELFCFFVGRVDEVGFIRHAHLPAGCSPDGLLSDGSAGVEIKCPFSSVPHFAVLAHGAAGIKQEYVAQMAFSMWITGLPAWWFVSYDPRFVPEQQLVTILTERDEGLMRRFDEVVPEFLARVDELAELARNRGQRT